MDAFLKLPRPILQHLPTSTHTSSNFPVNYLKAVMKIYKCTSAFGHEKSIDNKKLYQEEARNSNTHKSTLKKTMADSGGSSNWGSTSGGAQGSGNYKNEGTVKKQGSGNYQNEATLIPKERKHVSTMVFEKIIGKDKKSSSKVKPSG